LAAPDSARQSATTIRRRRRNIGAPSCRVAGREARKPEAHAFTVQPQSLRGPAGQGGSVIRPGAELAPDWVGQLLQSPVATAVPMERVFPWKVTRAVMGNIIVRSLLW